MHLFEPYFKVHLKLAEKEYSRYPSKTHIKLLLIIQFLFNLTLLFPSHLKFEDIKLNYT